MHGTLRQDWKNLAQKGQRIVHPMFQWRDMINSSHTSACSFYQFRRIRKGLIKLLSKFKQVRNSQQWYNMSFCSEVCPSMATFVAPQVILSNFEVLILNRLRISFDAKVWQILHNTASNGSVWPHLVNVVDVWSRTWSVNVLGLIEAEVKNIGLGYQVMAGMAVWSKIEQIWPKGAQNGPLYILVARCNKFWPY